MATEIGTPSFAALSNMQKQVLVTKEYIVKYPTGAPNSAAKTKKRTMGPTGMVIKVVVVEGETQTRLTASELAEILDMEAENQTKRTKKTVEMH